MDCCGALWVEDGLGLVEDRGYLYGVDMVELGDLVDG